MNYYLIEDTTRGTNTIALPLDVETRSEASRWREQDYEATWADSRATLVRADDLLRDRIEAASGLAELADALNDIHCEDDTHVYHDLTSLPIYAPEPDAGAPLGAYSWDDDAYLVYHDERWVALDWDE